MNDFSFWEELKKTITPLKKAKMGRFLKRTLPIRLSIRRNPPELLHTLDLHGFTVEEAYRIFLSFVQTHLEHGSKSITVITGKGISGQGLIHKEMPLWLENKKIADKIREIHWKHDGGCVEILFKKVKK